MKVVHIVGGALNGGAARGAVYLHQALRELGVDSELVCGDPEPIGAGIATVSSGLIGVAGGKIRNALERFPLAAYPQRRRALFSTGIAGVNWPRKKIVRVADIVHLHWVNGGMLSIPTLARMDKPCIWTLRDMWPFTGGCHYSLDCRRYEMKCGCCPILGSSREKDLSRWVFDRKLKSFGQNLSIVGISNWIAECARDSTLFRCADIRVILNCIDVGVFRPMDMIEARYQLGLPQDKFVLLHGALYQRDDYKGGGVLEEAKKVLSNDDIYVCAFGREGGGQSIRCDRSFGYVDDDRLLRAVYSAADVCVFPSVQEAFGKVAAEALACGTPVVAFDATGPSDIVQHKRTGYLAKPFEASDLASGVRWLLFDRGRLARIRREAAADAQERFSPMVAARQYSKLYEEKLASRSE